MASRRAAPEGARRSFGAAVVLTSRGSGDAAALAAPGLDALVDGESRDYESRHRVEPPDAKESVAAKPDQEGHRHVGAEQVLGALAGGRRRADPLADPLLGDPEHGHEDDRARREPNPDPTRLGLVAAEQVATGLDRDVGGEEEEG